MRVIAAVLALGCVLSTAADTQPTIAFTNGRWFNGREFESRVMYTVNGLFQTQRPAGVDSTIDLGGGFAVPPFGEAHNHNVEGSSRTDITLARYVQEGILYVMNPNNLPRSVTAVADKINKPNAIDVIFSHGGLNVTGGHPSDLVQRNIARGSWRPEDAEGAFYHTIDDRAALEAKWPKIVAGKPDFIKIYLLFSNEYDKRRSDTIYNGFKGLDPALVPEIVRRAHAAGLRVGAHIENVYDLRAAVRGGVDMVMHMPGYGWRGSGDAADSAQYAITAPDAADAKRRATTVVTTLAFGQRASGPGQTPSQLRRNAVNAANLRLLKDAGVAIAIGSDNYGATSRSEALYLSDLSVFTNLELLKIWSEATPALIFPKRKIATLRDGYEASFVVLDGDPLQDFGSVQRVTRRVKQGHVLP